MRRITLSRTYRTVLFAVIVGVAALSTTQPLQAQGDEVGYLYQQLTALRAQHGLGPLNLNAQLTSSAQVHSNYLASHLYVDPHVEANGSTPQQRISAAGYPGMGGENVVGGQTATVTWAFNWWVNSPAHYNNMLYDWTDVGIAVAGGGDYGRWYTMDFGKSDASPRPAAVPVSSGPVIRPLVRKEGPRPTARPPTQGPTLTPSITYTPSLTFTPNPTFTPTFTETPIPPTETAIVLEVSPQAQVENVNGVQVAALPSVTYTPIPATLPPSPTRSTAVAVVSTPAGNGSNSTVNNAPKTGSSDVIRNLIPWAIVLNFVVVGGLVVSSLRRRKK